MGTAPPAELLKVAAVDVPVRLQTDEQDMEIRPGDYLMADLNGVVVLPVELAEEALSLMQKQVEVSLYFRLFIPYTGASRPLFMFRDLSLGRRPYSV